MSYLISDISDDTELLPVNAGLSNPTYPLFYDLASETVKVLAGANTTEWQVARGVGNTQAVRHSRGTPLVLNANPYSGGGGGVTGTDGTTTVDPLTSIEFPTGMLADAGGGAGSAMGGLGIGFRLVSTGSDDADATTYATVVDGTAYGQNVGATGDGRADASSAANTAGDGTALARKQAVATGDGDANADSSAATSGFGGATSNTAATAHGNGNAATNLDAIAEGNGNARAVITAGVAGTGSATSGLLAIASGGQSGVDIVSDVTSARMGFNGSTPIAKPTVTGSRGGNAALASLLTQLAALGLITDNSS